MGDEKMLKSVAAPKELITKMKLNCPKFSHNWLIITTAGNISIYEVFHVPSS